MSISEDKYRRLRQELIGGIFALIVVFLLGTLWYHLIEGWSWLDSAYMTISTLATVGFGEINPLGERGRLFTMVLIVMGVITIGYIVNRLTEALIQGYFQEGLKQRQEKRLIDRLSEHYIICGLGRTGRQVAIEFHAENIPFVVIDTDPLQVNRAKELNYIVVQGDATLDKSLQMAGIERAICIVAALTSDAENLYTVLSAKTLNPKIRAIARASTEEAVDVWDESWVRDATVAERQKSTLPPGGRLSSIAEEWERQRQLDRTLDNANSLWCRLYCRHCSRGGTSSAIIRIPNSQLEHWLRFSSDWYEDGENTKKSLSRRNPLTTCSSVGGKGPKFDCFGA